MKRGNQGFVTKCHKNYWVQECEDLLDDSRTAEVTFGSYGTVPDDHQFVFNFPQNRALSTPVLYDDFRG